ncbi:hypothetical protein UJ101_01013 [Flavobacteriaceae bacterium UJ101]|nr:hypothetical protein UJ101_01013 [Flavobacteriaceae bacterium UJ101]
MIDFIKARIINTNEQILLTNDLLNFTQTSKINDTTNKKEVIRKQAKYRAITITIFKNNQIIISGSLHKYFAHMMDIKAPIASNKKNDFNGFDFKYSMLVKVLDDLKNKFKIPLENYVLQNIEFGVNIKPPIASNLILDNLILHNGISFIEPIKNYKQADHFEYKIKIYDKAKQYQLNEPCIRIENKYVKMRKANKMGIYNLSHLGNLKILDKLQVDLLERFNEILIYDATIDKSKLTQRQKIKLKDYCNSNYWLSLKSTNRHRPKQRYLSIVKNHSTDIKETLFEIIEDKTHYLISA